MSDYKIVNGKKVRVCKFGCGIQLGEFDTKQNKYLETDGTLHTRERCESLKPKEKQATSTQPFTLEAVQQKLESIGIIINVERLMKQQ